MFHSKATRALRFRRHFVGPDSRVSWGEGRLITEHSCTGYIVKRLKGRSKTTLFQEYQRWIKRGFKESHSAGNKKKMYHQYKEAVERGEDIGVVVRLAREAGTSAALTARTVLEEWLSAQREEGEGRVDDKVVKQQVKSVKI